MLLPHRWQQAGKMVERIKSMKETLAQQSGSPPEEVSEAALCAELRAELERIHTRAMSLDELDILGLRDPQTRISDFGQHQFGGFRAHCQFKYKGSRISDYGCGKAIANLVADPKGLAE